MQVPKQVTEYFEKAIKPLKVNRLFQKTLGACKHMLSVNQSKVREESTQRRGKDHCTAGLQFDQTGFDRGRKYVVIRMQLNANL